MNMPYVELNKEKLKLTRSNAPVTSVCERMLTFERLDKEQK